MRARDCFITCAFKPVLRVSTGTGNTFKIGKIFFKGRNYTPFIASALKISTLNWRRDTEDTPTKSNRKCTDYFASQTLPQRPLS